MSLATTKFDKQMEITELGEPVKYGDYEGFKTETYIHDGGKYPKYVPVHLKEQMPIGFYDINVELDIVKGKPVARLEYTPSSTKSLASKDTTKS